MTKRTLEERSSPKKPSKLNLSLKAIGVAALLSVSNAHALVVAEITPPTSLKLEKVPEPSNLDEFILNKSNAIALGKALFWELRIGSNGKTACATCHFTAGVDNRIKNQLAPAHDMSGFHSNKPNQTLKADDFPFTKFDTILGNDKNGGKLIRDNRDVAGSAGVFTTRFISATPGASADEEELVPDPVFNLPTKEFGNLNVYQVTPRNTPPTINAIFNLRNFWDGRAQTIFNGVNPFGKRDPRAGVYKIVNGKLVKTKVTINDSSIASLATGPALSTIEMSAEDRYWPNIGRRVLPMRALEGQAVSLNDSVLGPHTTGDGLKYSYIDIIKHTFKPEWWATAEKVTIQGEPYYQMEANMSLFFGLAVQTYLATLVSDDTPFDRYMEGDAKALTAQQLNGLKVFMDKGKCVSCHGGPLFTNAAIKRKPALGQTERMSRMIMGDGNQAVYDEGFYNIAVTRTQDDVGVGGFDPFGNPLSFTRLAKAGSANFWWKEGDLPNVNVQANERDAVQGAFKTPTLRNIALTAPYFHNGGYGTLRQVVEFYNRGGNFPGNNRNDLDADIEPLGLTEGEIDDLVAFMEGLTDPRVTNHAAPFDHPEIRIADGFTGDENGNGTLQDPDLPGAALDIEAVIPAVGKNGYDNVRQSVPKFSERIGFDNGPSVLPEPDASRLTKCASEGGTCNLTGIAKPAIVYYADNLLDLKRKEFYTGKFGVMENSIACNNATFGDPKFGYLKECYIYTK